MQNSSTANIKLGLNIFGLPMPPSSSTVSSVFDERMMREALQLAESAATKGEVPVGAVVVVAGEIIARAHNEVEAAFDATAHAEVLALRRAGEVRHGWRLNEATLYVTLEPCTMCAGAILNARVGRVVFAAHDKRAGAAGSIYNLLELGGKVHPGTNQLPEIVTGICAQESEELLARFFSKRR
ncbi:MAG: tRNA adenosine(34) deaminase TadA [bacterium]|nr:tRNA adenosine(34) deaminase TadA [bacterium]